MYDNLTYAGVPLGPLSDPVDLIVYHDSPGTLHTGQCRGTAGSFSTAVDLTREPDGSFCLSCEEFATDEQVGYAQEANDLHGLLSDAQLALRGLAASTDDHSMIQATGAFTAHQMWHVLFRRRWAAAHPAPGPTNHLDALRHWGRDVVVPVVDQALDGLLARLPFLQLPDWRERRVRIEVALGGLGDALADGLYRPETLTVLFSGRTGRKNAANRHDRSMESDSEAIPTRVRNRAAAAYRDGATAREAAEAGRLEGVRLLDAIPEPDQAPLLPADAVFPDGSYATVGEAMNAAWRANALSEIDGFCDRIADLLEADLGPTHAVAIDTTQSTWDLSRHVNEIVVHAYAHSRLPDGRIVALLPAAAYDVAVGTSRSGLHRDLGPVSPADTTEVYALAVELSDSTVEDRHAAETARAALL